MKERRVLVTVVVSPSSLNIKKKKKKLIPRYYHECAKKFPSI